MRRRTRTGPRVDCSTMTAPTVAAGPDRGERAIPLAFALVSACPPAELEGVIAHEMAHVKHRDVALQTAVVVLSASMIELSRIGGWLERALLFVLGPIAAACVHLLLSPKRGFEADRRAAELCEAPHGLAEALVRVDQAAEPRAVKA